MFPHRHVKRIRERRVLSGSQKRGFLKWRAASTSTSPVLDIFSVNLATIKSNSLSIPISIKCTEENQTVETLGLIDSGARGKFIDQNFAKTIGLKTQPLQRPITARNIDGTEKKHGRITCFADINLTIHGRTTKTHLLLTESRYGVIMDNILEYLHLNERTMLLVYTNQYLMIIRHVLMGRGTGQGFRQVAKLVPGPIPVETLPAYPPGITYPPSITTWSWPLRSGPPSVGPHQIYIHKLYLMGFQQLFNIFVSFDYLVSYVF